MENLSLPSAPKTPVKPETFDLLTHTFQTGAALIEASAGTGKTYSIAMLVVRLVVEKGIAIDETLVVTFTKAATEELKDRIRARFVEAKEHLQGKTTDDLLVQWTQTLSDKDEALKRIAAALANIDQAGIFTIHSFCQRILMEYPLESGQSFSGELSTNIDQYKDRVLRDFWRRNVYLRPAEEVNAILYAINQMSVNATVFNPRYKNALQKHGSHLGKLGYLLSMASSETRLEPETVPLDEIVQTFLKAQNAIHTFFAELEPELFNLLDKAKSSEWIAKNKIVKCFRLYENRHVEPKEFFDYLPSAFKKAHISELDLFLEDIDTPFSLFEQMKTLSQQLPVAIIQALLKDYFTELSSQLQSENEMSFDDLILQLAFALNQGEKSQFLQRQISARFKAAFIDEFQDTDRHQWQIFSTLFNQNTTYLYLIGDPKQAIYKFRGADIYAYLQAKKDCQFHYTLDTNWRSTPQLVEAVNTLFSQAEDPFLTKPIEEIGDFPFHPVNAGRSQIEKHAAFHFWQMPAAPEELGKSVGRGNEKQIVWKADNAEQVIRQNILSHISEQLQNGEKPESFAILVRGNKTAASYQTECLRHGIPAVINAKTSVFETPQATELLYVMRALSEPSDLRKAKQALATTWFGFNAEKLIASADSGELENWLESLFEHHQTWVKKGFMAAIYGLIDDWQVREILAQTEHGERSLTNIFHMMELVQAASLNDHLNITKTIAFLEQQILNPPAGEDEVLRLETDENAVQIVTLHSSKGLQYKTVYCPDLWRFKSDRANHLLSVHELGETIIDMGSEKFEARAKRIENEMRAEDMRLIYVALTRAEEELHVVFGPALENYLKSPFYELLKPGLPDSEAFAITELDIAPAIQNYQADRPVINFETADFTRQAINTRRRVFSFSGLVKNRAIEAPTDKGQELEENHSALQTLKSEISLLPKGAEFGNLVHDLLEKCSFSGLAKGVDSDMRQTLSDQYGVKWSEAIEQQTQLFDALIQKVVTTPLDTVQSDFTLANLPEHKVLKEMAFFYAIHPTQTQQLNQILSQTDIPYSPIGADAIEGYLNGFIDLVAEHQGKFYVMDYKTNYLGNDCENYSFENMHQEMTHHSYGLQFTLYSLALHQYLKNRVVEYDYQQHFGGIKYLFVRGMNGKDANFGVYDYRPSLELIESLEALIRGAKDAA
ncbi:exodeoxyribonuclease V subunit beta [Thiomicrorhabdus indica]|uniref:exodeoxyribonuclease V subunit beta n=1 Tax=Thiomicrorhabdus indica TaxID=2267253 RepID=UPI00102DF5CC|nr:exodeoxyribonuclease V subunit beta [Thiomicrorhabdus indica]